MTSRAGDENPKNFVQSVVKAFSVLKVFDASLPELTLTEIAGRTALDRGTTFRLVNTLCHLGYVTQVTNTRRYRLTLKCLELGYASLSQTELKVLARPLLAAIVPNVADAASLGVLDGPDVVYVERSQIEFPRLNLDRRVGSRTGAYGAALGHAILAGLPLPQQKTILEKSERVRTSEKTLVEVSEILERLVEVKRRGYAISDGENAYGLRTVAAPIVDQDGYPVAGVSFTVHQDRCSMDEFIQAAVPALRDVVQQLSQAMKQSFGSVRVSR